MVFQGKIWRILLEIFAEPGSVEVCSLPRLALLQMLGFPMFPQDPTLGMGQLEPVIPELIEASQHCAR